MNADTDAPLGILGVGQLAAHLVKGLRRAGVDRPILLLPRSRGIALELTRDWGCEIAPDKAGLASRCRQIILACRPADLPGAAADLPLTARHLVLSAVAAASVADLAALLGGDVSVRRFMPGISVEAGVGAIPLYPGDTRAQALLSALGQVIVAADEAAFDALTAATCAHGWFYSLFDSLISGLEAQGLAPEAARTAVLHHARGAAELCLARPDLRPRAISRDVAAPGSYTAAGLRYLEDGGVHARLRIALESVLRALRRPPAVTAGHPDLSPRSADKPS
ncbi:pyrroline-5-carboxylate reductase [Achromobacter sp. AONIH1]|uniref:pyrroline-5-carboxylate reductase family protein n=1 Tax=Achromobacter sp. AONIH1 TaxID=1758194 RepID=UPI00131A0A64|nr:pyrroline-5-carboxylate reductase dimerization domain-containing protein [Achromobacter sp. AONIH1]